MKFTKSQATGNDFIIIDARDMDMDWSKLAQEMCHRRFGVGADGLILVRESDSADFEMRIINSDGSEAEICGNGLRCFARYIVDRGMISGPDLTVSTLAGVRKVQTFGSGGKVRKAKVNMGTPRFSAADIPVTTNEVKDGREELDIKLLPDYSLTVDDRKMSLSFVSMGNPHAVCFLANPVAEFPLHQIGPKVENNVMFPQRINFEIARVLSGEKIEARVWERGAGETMACGSGACAIAVVARLKGYINEQVDIKLPGGELTINWDGNGDIYLTGGVEEVFYGEWLK